MSFFQKIKSKFSKQSSSTHNNQANNSSTVITKQFVLSRYLEQNPVSDMEELIGLVMGIGFISQTRLGELLKNRSWSLDFDSGRIQFEELGFEMGFIGSQSHLNDTWIWGNHNINNLPQAAIQDISNFIEQFDLEFAKSLKSPKLTVDGLLYGHTLSALVSTYFDNYVYYRCPYDNGEAFVLIKSAPKSLFKVATTSELVNAITYVINNYSAKHTRLIEPLLQKFATITSQSAQRWVVEADEDSLIIDFDFEGRIENMTTNVHQNK